MNQDSNGEKFENSPSYSVIVSDGKTSKDSKQYDVSHGLSGWIASSEIIFIVRKFCYRSIKLSMIKNESFEISQNST